MGKTAVKCQHGKLIHIKGVIKWRIKILDIYTFKSLLYNKNILQVSELKTNSPVQNMNDYD